MGKHRRLSEQATTLIRRICCSFVLSLLVAACGSEEHARADSVTITPSKVAVATRNEHNAEPCAHNGLWALCSVERRLRQSGFVVTRVEGQSPSRPGFDVKPAVYTLGKARLEVFIYESEKAMARDVAAMDTILVTPRGSVASWESTPLLIRSANLAAVLLTTNQRLAERASLALTAGPPQPGSPR